MTLQVGTPLGGILAARGLQPQGMLQNPGMDFVGEEGLGSRDLGLSGLEFRVQGFRVKGLEFRV